MKPISQIFELVVELLPGYPHAKNRSYIVDLENHYYNKFDGDLKKTAKKVSDVKKELVQRLVFQPLIDYAERKVSKRVTLDKWFTASQPQQHAAASAVDISQAVSQPREQIPATIKKKKQSTLTSFLKPG